MPVLRERFLRWRVEPDGMVDGTFRLPPGTAAALVAAVDATGMRTSTSPIVTTSATANVDRHTITDELELRCAPCHHRRHAHEDRGQG